MAANVCLLIALAGLGVWNVRTWTHPPYPDHIDGETVRPPPRDPPANLVDRKAYSANAISGVTQNNLFQEERRSFFVQPAPRPANVAAAVPKVPPPNLTLRGVVLLDGKELALLEGTYPVAQPGAPVAQKPVIHKGYGVGARIGEYKITRIEKTGITLDNAKGEKLNLKLVKFPTDQLNFPASNIADKSKSVVKKAARTAAKPVGKNNKASSRANQKNRSRTTKK